MVEQVSSNAVNGIYNDWFTTKADYFPWLALNLGGGFLYKVPVCSCN